MRTKKSSGRVERQLSPCDSLVQLRMAQGRGGGGLHGRLREAKEPVG